MFNKYIPPIPETKQRVFVIYLLILALTAVLSLFLTTKFTFTPPKPREIRLIVAIFLFLVFLGWLICVKGVRYTLLISIPYIIAFLLVEVGVRTWFDFYASPEQKAFLYDPRATQRLGSETVYVPHHYSLYNTRPDYSNKYGTIHNNLGFRDHRNFEPYSDQSIRIVFLGGSTTYTIGIKDNQQIFSYKLEENLNRQYEDALCGKSLEVINAGMGGASSAENLVRLAFFVSELHPDLVVIQHGINDVVQRIANPPIKSDYSNYRKMWGLPKLKHLAKGHIVITSLRYTLRKSLVLSFLLKLNGLSPLYKIGNFVSHPEIVYGEKQPADYFERNTKYMIALCKSMEAEVVLATMAIGETASEMRQTMVPEHNEIMARLAATMDCNFFDFATLMNTNIKFMPDARHLNQNGSDLKMNLYHDYFNNSGIIDALIAKRSQ